MRARGWSWICLAGVALALWQAGRASSMVADIPLPFLVQESDLVIVARVIGGGEAAEMRLQPPGAVKPRRGWFRTYRIAVERVLRDANATGRKAPLKEISVLAPSPRPRKPGQPRIYVADGPAYPTLAVGTSYVLLLKRMVGREEHFLPAYFKNFRRADENTVKEIARLADLEQWPWGEAQDGLQMALVPSRRTLTAGRRRGGGPSVFIQCTVAVRNVSDKPLAVNLYPEDRSLSLTATDAEGNVQTADLYGWLARADLRAFGPWALHEIAPGRMLFVGPSGAPTFGLGVNLPLRPGAWRLQAGYASKRDAKSAGGLAAWTGAITSKAVEVRVIEGHRRP